MLSTCYELNFVYSVMSSHFCTSNVLLSLSSAKLTLCVRSSSINLSHFRLYQILNKHCRRDRIRTYDPKFPLMHQNLLYVTITDYVLFTFALNQLSYPPINKNKTQTISVVTFVGSLLNSTLQPLVNWKNLITILTPWFQPILWNYFTVYPNLKFCF